MVWRMCVCVGGGAVGSVLFGLGDVVCLSVECSGELWSVVLGEREGIKCECVGVLIVCVSAERSECCVWG
ncbi:putative cell division protein SepF-like protein [Encephalitozoon cuniculi]|nr:putative cell division protein SepF-like protein [Encephalitozoon cuniculi]